MIQAPHYLIPGTYPRGKKGNPQIVWLEGPSDRAE